MNDNILLYYWPTPNGWKITIALEEMELPYTIRLVDLAKGEQFEEAFTVLSPNRRMPAIVDPKGPNGQPISIFESGAILQYLARKTGKFYGETARQRIAVDEWLMWQMGGLGPMAGQAFHFLKYAPSMEPPHDLPYAKDRYRNEISRLFGVLDERLLQNFGGVNPRTALGVDKDGRTLWIVVVDGRQPGVSAGITLVELACLFQSLNAWDALNLDGGGSSAFVLENAEGSYDVVNTPVGRVMPNTLRQVANNLGLYLPGKGTNSKTNRPTTLREEVIRIASSRRGGGYILAGGGVSRDIIYDGQTILHANPEGTYCCGATLEAFLDAYCRHEHGLDAPPTRGRWFKDWPKDKFITLQQGWYGTEESPTNPLLPEQVRPTIREKQVFHILQWTGLAKPVDDYRLLRRGDFVQIWRKSGTGHSVIFWGRDRDEDGRERLWYWSSQPKPRYAYPQTPGGKPTKTPGYGINWEYIGDEIDPARIYGVSLID